MISLIQFIHNQKAHLSLKVIEILFNQKISFTLIIKGQYSKNFLIIFQSVRNFQETSQQKLSQYSRHKINTTIINPKNILTFLLVFFKQFVVIKQFVVTNCSKERPGSIVTKTLKNGILIPIATSKESHFNSDFKYISFIKFNLTHQKLRA